MVSGRKPQWAKRSTQRRDADRLRAIQGHPQRGEVQPFEVLIVDLVEGQLVRQGSAHELLRESDEWPIASFPAAP